MWFGSDVILQGLITLGYNPNDLTTQFKGSFKKFNIYKQNNT